jgi:hypothetical protein
MTEDPAVANMEARLQQYLTRGDGKFCFENLAWKIGYVTVAMFRKFIQSKVQSGKLRIEKDTYGRVWYHEVI